MLDLSFDEGKTLGLAKNLQKIQPRLSEDRAVLLARAIAAVDTGDNLDPPKVEAWLHTVTRRLSECSASDLMIELEVGQGLLREIVQECNEESDRNV